MMRVLVRVDASALLGTGHVARCLALADELKSRGHQVTFAMRSLPGHLIAETRAQGFEVFSLADSFADVALTQAAWITMTSTQGTQLLDASQTLQSLPHRFWDWAVVDHYALGADWQLTIGGAVQKLLAIDDLADRPLQCDALLNQNLGAAAARYVGLIPPRCQVLLGPYFALLRSEFSTFTPNRLVRATAFSTPRILVSLGGIDAEGYTLRVLHALGQCGLRGDAIIVVAGAQNPHFLALQKQCDALGYTLLRSTRAMAELMVQSDWAVGAGGVSLLERCVVGLPSIAIAIAPNQQPGVAAANAQGAVLALDSQAPGFESSLRQAIQVMLTFPVRLQAMSQAGLALCDAKGAARVADVLQAGAITLRSAKLEDSEELHVWRNAPETRKYSGDDQAIGLAQHKRWLRGVLADSERRLWIASIVSGPVGVLRFDCCPSSRGTVAEISVYRVPGRTGRNWGKALITRGVQAAQVAWPSLRRIDARISGDNLASLQAFAACGFYASAMPGLYQKNLEKSSL